MTLKRYRQKRDFTKTAEPPGVVDKSTQDRFVIQKHAASHLHYDFRLQVNGTLKSWAVPKGIPYAPGERRLAIEVEDHPVSYIQFEGTIPKGQYGGGTVMVWDQGTYQPIGPDPAAQLRKGKLHFHLTGTKLNGQWHLVRMSQSNQWLLIKSAPGMRPLSKKTEDTSALTGRTMAQITDADPSKPTKPALKAPKPKPSRARKQSILPFVEPMKALLVDAPPPGDWLYEIKFDGFRALAFKNQDAIQLLSRNNKNFADRFPEVIDSLTQLNEQNIVLDGEIVALTPDGHSSFQLLQAYQLGEEKPPICYYVFDILWHDGKDLRPLPLHERRALLKTLLAKPPDGIRYSDSFEGSPKKLLKHAQKLGLEGLVAKRPDSAYETGKRSGAWVKLKLLNQQEFVIGGFTPPSGSRKYIGALTLGVREKDNWVFTGKVGTGFTQATLKALHARLMPLATDQCPFSNLPQTKRSRYGQAITAAELKRCQWVKPQLVAQIKFAGWTRDQMLRQPVFLGLREDKPAIEVVKEKAKHP